MRQASQPCAVVSATADPEVEKEVQTTENCFVALASGQDNRGIAGLYGLAQMLEIIPDRRTQI